MIEWSMGHEAQVLKQMYPGGQLIVIDTYLDIGLVIIEAIANNLLTVKSKSSRWGQTAPGPFFFFFLFLETQNEMNYN